MSSPFASQLGTNYCPQDAELSQIKAFLVEPRLRLNRLDAEIAVLRKALDKLADERDTLNTYVEAHAALMSPVRRLPIDIIEAIFVSCLPTHRNCVMSAQEAPPTRSPNSPPELLEAKAAQRLKVASAWLRRSGSCPLSLSLESEHSTTPPSSPSPPNQSLFLDLLVQFAFRWQHIDLVIPPVALATLSRLTADDVPLLTALRISQRPPPPPNSISPTQLGVLRGPNLTSLSIPGTINNVSQSPVRWDRLTDLSLFSPQTCEIILEVLSRCPRLQTSKLIVHEPVETHLTDNVVECTSLHTLELLCAGTPLLSFGRLLSRLALPGLRDLKLVGVQRLFGALRPELLISSLAALTHLETITIDSALISKPLLINFLRGTPSSLPRARGTGHRKCREASDEALLRFVLSRAPTLKRVDIKFDRERRVDILSSLQQFTEAGLKISLTYVSPSFSPWAGLSDGAPAPLPVG
ncbi:hypothetical protein K438DRAFT_1823110 [Mycena galopus ATCC 62051]|nr:hypothetical protein K438DRAFT_1823110 [Mycena galopus ATCC 62051]